MRVWTFLMNPEIPPSNLIKTCMFISGWNDEFLLFCSYLLSIAVKKPLETSVTQWILCCWTLLRWTSCGCECSTRATVGTERKGSERGRSWGSLWEQTWSASVSWKGSMWRDTSRWDGCPFFLTSASFFQTKRIWTCRWAAGSVVALLKSSVIPVLLKLFTRGKVENTGVHCVLRPRTWFTHSPLSLSVTLTRKSDLSFLIPIFLAE